MSESKKNVVSGSDESKKDELEGASGSGVRIRKRRGGKKRKSSKPNSKDGVSSSSFDNSVRVTSSIASEQSQSEWLNEIVPNGEEKKKKCITGCVIGWIDENKYSLAAGVFLIGTLVWFTYKKMSCRGGGGGGKCPFTGKKT